jgi:hypothetical protein
MRLPPCQRHEDRREKELEVPRTTEFHWQDTEALGYTFLRMTDARYPEKKYCPTCNEPRKMVHVDRQHNCKNCGRVLWYDDLGECVQADPEPPPPPEPPKPREPFAVGQLLVLTMGHYSDYNVGGVVRVLEAFSADTERHTWLVMHPDQEDTWDFEQYGFWAWLAGRGLIENVEHVEWHAGDGEVTTHDPQWAKLALEASAD